MMAKTVEPGMTETYGSASSSVPPCGIERIKTPRGEVDVMEVGGLTTFFVEVGKSKSVAILLYEDERQVGMLNQMSAAAARDVGASLIRIADMVELLERN